jgi:hypothetical protein
MFPKRLLALALFAALAVMHVDALLAQMTQKAFSVEATIIDTTYHMNPSSSLPGKSVTDTVASSVYSGGFTVCGLPYGIYLQKGSSIILATLDSASVNPDTLILSFEVPAGFDTGSYDLVVVDGLECERDTEITPSAFTVGNVAGVVVAPATIQRIRTYPNPLSQSTSITFTLAEANEVTLTITNALGCETPLLHSAWMDAGQHEITWDASNYPSGVYLCRLSSGGESVTDRVVVLK